MCAAGVDLPPVSMSSFLSACLLFFITHGSRPIKCATPSYFHRVLRARWLTGSRRPKGEDGEVYPWSRASCLPTYASGSSLTLRRCETLPARKRLHSRAAGLVWRPLHKVVRREEINQHCRIPCSIGVASAGALSAPSWYRPRVVLSFADVPRTLIESATCEPSTTVSWRRLPIEEFSLRSGLQLAKRNLGTRSTSSASRKIEDHSDLRIWPPIHALSSIFTPRTTPSYSPAPLLPPPLLPSPRCPSAPHARFRKENASFVT
ncbi:hypothetical protein B0H13DRAFT_2537513 [Mycena leptocephala]|nr:hypothetical protein B0H13DRAFT_2537513 [Mycena leptocephala]